MNDRLQVIRYATFNNFKERFPVIDPRSTEQHAEIYNVLMRCSPVIGYGVDRETIARTLGVDSNDKRGNEQVSQLLQAARAAGFCDKAPPIPPAEISRAWLPSEKWREKVVVKEDPLVEDLRSQNKELRTENQSLKEALDEALSLLELATRPI
jgi:hypothetical protein